jgi:predicted Zn-dependent peptidase
MKRVKRLLSVDWDFFFPVPGSGTPSRDWCLYDWGRDERRSAFFALAVWHARAAAFRVHPYHHEVIGDVADLASMTREDLYAHYRRYYIPNNAILAAAGDFQWRPMLDRIRELEELVKLQAERLEEELKTRGWK